MTCERFLRPLAAPLGTDPGLLELDVTSSAVPRCPGFQATAIRCSVSPAGLSISPCPAKPDRFPRPEHIKRAPSFLGGFLLLYWQQSLGNAQQRWEHLSLNHQSHGLRDPLFFPGGVSASPARSNLASCGKADKIAAQVLHHRELALLHTSAQT